MTNIPNGALIEEYGANPSEKRGRFPTALRTNNQDDRCRFPHGFVPRPQAASSVAWASEVHGASLTWRLLVTSGVASEWRLRSLRLYADTNCSGEAIKTVPAAAPFRTQSWDSRRLPNGQAFAGSGPTLLAGGAFDTTGAWYSSGHPCVAPPDVSSGSGGKVCFLGFSFETDYGCMGASAVVGHYEAAVRCVAFEQSGVEGQYAEALELQWRDSLGNFRHWASAQNLTGGAAQIA